MKNPTYKAIRNGCVIETDDDCVIYERIEGIPAKEIAQVMNEMKAEGVPEEWDWRKVERRLFDKGIVQECKA